MDENSIARIVVNSAYKIHTDLGQGLLESVYEVILRNELRRYNLSVEQQKVIPIIYNGVEFPEAFRADLIVEKKIIIELKSIEEISKSHKKQLITYLCLTNPKSGLLINFGAALIKDGIYRVVNGLPE
jgi:GxxExxY protein